MVSGAPPYIWRHFAREDTRRQSWTSLSSSLNLTSSWTSKANVCYHLTPCYYGATHAIDSPASTSQNNRHDGHGRKEQKEFLFKLLVIGELGTGKTSFIKRYVHQFFSTHYRATIGVDFALKVVNWDDHSLIRLQLWDIAGQERFGNMTRVYYKEAVGAFVVFDVSRPPTFDAVVKWKNDLDTKVSLPDGSHVPCVLLANKCDMTKEGTVASASTLDEFCRDNGFAGWFHTSAKDNINVEESARFLVSKILAKQRSLSMVDSTDNGVVSLEKNQQQEVVEKKACAC